MGLDPIVVVFDACVLYPFHLRNIVVQIAVDRLADARWTDEIHDEWIGSLVADVPGLSIERLQITRKLMIGALPEAMVTGYQKFLETITLPDPHDRHVVAAAISAGASVVLSWNLRDFPAREMKKHGLVCQTPDIFLTGLYDKAPNLVLASLANARRNLTKSRVSVPGFIDIVKNQKLTRLAAKISRRTSDL